MDVVDDEERQQTPVGLLSRLQEEVRELGNETKHNQEETQTAKENLQKEMRDCTANINFLKDEIRELHVKLHDLEEAKVELQDDVGELKQQLHDRGPLGPPVPLTNANTPSSNLMRQPTFAIPSIFHRNIVSHDGLPPDTFALMMTSPIQSQAWLLGIVAFIFQMALIVMIGVNQIKESELSSDFNVPFKVDGVVRAGQLLTIIFALATQNDITTSIRFILILWKDRRWDRTLFKRDEGVHPPTSIEWIIHVLVPNGLKLSQGILVMLITFVIIVQSDNIIDLLKDFTALMVLSETDNIFFGLAFNGYLGRELQRKTIEALDIKIPDDVSNSGAGPDSDGNAADTSSPLSSPSTNKSYLTRPIILLVIALAMIGGWIIFVINQLNGKYFYQRYPDCNATNAYDLAKKHFGDDMCYGGPLNTPGCEFEGGDCVNFNLAFPLCKGDSMTNVQKLVGDGHCDEIFMNAECDYDGGDCCPYKFINDPSFGDGNCDEQMNTERCGYDNGDCVSYNRDFDGCPLDVVFKNPMFGDGQCNGGILSTEACRHDNGDCNEFLLSHPSCPLDKLSVIEGADSVVIGDGMCNSGIYNVRECGYKFGDCNYGQLGQDVFITTQILWRNRILISQSLSLGGTTMAIGLPLTDENGNTYYGSSGDFGYKLEPPGFVKVFWYDSSRRSWLQMGNNIVGDTGHERRGDRFGQVMALSSNGNRIAISSTSKVQVFDFNDTVTDEWSQTGQTIISEVWYGNEIGMTADGARLAIPDFNSKEIRIYDIEASSGKKTWVNHDHNVINGNDVFSDFDKFDLKELRVKLNSLDGSVLLLSAKSTLTKVFHFNAEMYQKTWIQMGQDIDSPDSSASFATSADGKRIAIPSNSTSLVAPGTVSVFDFNTELNRWIRIGNPIKGSLSSGDGFGYSITMSSDGNHLLIGSNDPKCQSSPNLFEMDDCSTGSAALYIYKPGFRDPSFKKVTPNPSSPYKASRNILDFAGLSAVSNIFGLHFSINGGGNVLTTCGYDLDDQTALIRAYDLDELFYTSCDASDPGAVGDGICDNGNPYNTVACRFDGGDCIVEGYPNCRVSNPNQVGNGICDEDIYTLGGPTYNAEDCGFDGGDCLVEGYPKCLGVYPERIGDGYCDDIPPYNTENCGFDGGDCVPKPVAGYANCFVDKPEWVGNGYCTNYPPYNAEACGLDGGDCAPKPRNDIYPDCLLDPNPPRLDFGYEYWIGDGQCQNFPPFNTEYCGFDGGDCIIEEYPNCLVTLENSSHYLDDIGNGRCQSRYNTEACGFDGGDCIPKGYPNCIGIDDPDLIGNGDCDNRLPYNTEACGFDGGDCIVDGYPKCLVDFPNRIGDGFCNNWPPYNTEICGFDGGDCL